MTGHLARLPCGLPSYIIRSQRSEVVLGVGWLATFVLLPWLEVAQDNGDGVREIPRTTGSPEIVAVPASD
jgi:hypothetical protein